MPSSSKKQHNFMAAVANNPAFAKKAGVPSSVGKEFIKTDKEFGMKKMSKGGDTTMSNKSKERKGMTMEKMGKVTAGGTKKFGEHSVQQKGHTRGKNLGDSGKTVGIMSGARGMKKGGMTKMKKGGRAC
jgi:hypothetical protein